MENPGQDCLKSFCAFNAKKVELCKYKQSCFPLNANFYTQFVVNFSQPNLIKKSGYFVALNKLALVDLTMTS